MRIALATCLKPPEPDPDQEALLGALADAGARARMAAWEDEAVDYAAFDLCVIRSTWNYVHRLEAYLGWAGRVSRATRLLNPPDVVRWNTDKSYLEALQARGVAVVPTEFVPRGAAESLESVAARRGWTDVVVKPRVGAASFSTRRFAAGRLAAGSRFLAGAAAGRDMMVQPYVPSVEGHGERALVWVDGEFTHAVRKSPRFAGAHERVSGALPVAADERRFGERVLEPCAKGLLYGRVDVTRGADGGLMLMELELVEPSLFLTAHPPALARFVQACVKACGGPLPGGRRPRPKRRRAGAWSVYVALCGDGSYYTGVAKDVEARLARHNAGKGAAYTRAHRPVSLAYREDGLTRSQALRREARIKSLDRRGKEELLSAGPKAPRRRRPSATGCGPGTAGRGSRPRPGSS